MQWMQFKRNLSRCTKWAGKLKPRFYFIIAVFLFLLQSSFCPQSSFLFQYGKNAMNRSTRRRCSVKKVFWEESGTGVFLWISKNTFLQNTSGRMFLYENMHHSSPYVSVITGNILIKTIRFACCHFQLASQSTFMTIIYFQLTPWFEQ